MEDLLVFGVPDKGKGVIARRDFMEGQVVCAIDFNGYLDRENSDNVAIQVWENLFVESNQGFLTSFINHSCNPNMRFRLASNYDFVAIKNIRRGEEVTFNYLTTEYDMAMENLDFDCRCGSENCYGRIRGFKYLTREQQEKLWPSLTPFLRLKIDSPKVSLDRVFSLNL